MGLRLAASARPRPHLRAPARIGYGPLIALSRPLLPDPADRHPVLRETPRRLLGFD